MAFIMNNRVSFSDYIYKIKLTRQLKANRNVDLGFTKNSINSFLIHSSDYAWINNIEFLSFSINQRCDTSKTDNNNDNCDIAINTDILNFINQCLLSTNRSKYHLPNGIKCKVYWHQLAKNRQFLEALVQLIATGYGDPYLQEISTILLRNICILVGTTEKHVQVEDYYPALENLLHITAGPLVIFSSSSGLGRITNWSTQALAGLLKATFTYHPDFCINYDPNAWTEKILLFCHVIHVFHRLLPKLFLTESSSFGSHEHLARLHRHIEDDTFDLEMLSAFLNLFIVTVKLPSVKLLLSSNDETRKVERKKFLSVIQYALSNLCLATGRAWLCTACADSLVTLDVFGFLDYQEVGNLFIGRKCTDHDFSHDLLHFICDLLKSLFNLVQIPYLKAYFVNISFKLMQCLLYLSKCLVYCSSLVYPSMTSECVLYAIRIVGCLCFNEIETGSTSRSTGLTHPNKISLFNNFLSIINWYHQRRCSWSMCGIELCWSLTNFVKCFNVPMFYHQLENDEALSCFIDSFLFRLFTLEGGSREVMYLLYVSIKMTQFSSVTDNNNYFWWIRILNQLDCRLKPQLIYWKYLKQNLPRCYIETFTYLLKFLSIILVYDNRVLWKYIKENCCTLLKLFSLCDNTLRILPSLTPSSLSVEETIRVICSSNSSEDIISYILSVVEYVS